jgi:hypothetical protein
LWHFHVYMYYNPSWFISSIFLHPNEFYVYSYIESTATIFTFLTSFFYPSSLVCDLTLAWPVFHNIVLFVSGLYFIY